MYFLILESRSRRQALSTRRKCRPTGLFRGMIDGRERLREGGAEIGGGLRRKVWKQRLVKGRGVHIGSLGCDLPPSSGGNFVNGHVGEEWPVNRA